MRIGKAAALAVAVVALAPATAQAAKRDSSLWKAYDRTLSKASYVDLTHRITPDIPVWKGFGSSTFEPTVNPETNEPYNFAKDGFEATAYHLATDQLGTQLDPPAHWDPNYPAIDELPASYAVRPLVVINTAPQVRKDPKYFLHTDGVKAWREARADPRGLRRDGPLRLVQALDRGPRQGEGAGRGPELPQRRPRRAEVPAPQAPHPVPRP